MKSRWRKIVLLAACSVVLLVGITLVIWRLGLTRANNRTIEALRRRGMPASRAELNDWYAAVPADKNVALPLTEAMEALRVRPPELRNMKLLGRGERLTNAALVTAYVETNQAAFQLITAALERPQCRYLVNFLRGSDSNWEHFEPLRNLGRLADDAALLASERGAGDEAAEHIATIAGLARTLKDEPTLLSQLVRISMLHMGARRFERVLSLAKVSGADLSRLARVFANSAETNCITRALIGERAMTMPVFRARGPELSRLMSSGGAAPQGPGADDLIVFPLMRITGFLERDLRFYLESMEQLIARSQLGPPQSLAAREIAENYAEEARRKYCVFSAINLPGLARALSREAEALALLRMAPLACAIEQFAAARGGLPEKLSDLTPVFAPQIASDPCDGQPLRYKRLDDGYMIYSVGADGRDDQGTEPDRQNRSSSQRPEDVVFRVRTPK